MFAASEFSAFLFAFDDFVPEFVEVFHVVFGEGEDFAEAVSYDVAALVAGDVEGLVAEVLDYGVDVVACNDARVGERIEDGFGFVLEFPEFRCAIL